MSVLLHLFTGLFCYSPIYYKINAAALASEPILTDAGKFEGGNRYIQRIYSWCYLLACINCAVLRRLFCKRIETKAAVFSRKGNKAQGNFLMA